ncbi:MAG: hypothetical protein ACI87A_001310, partial [Planctomycetota bacterium]
DGFAGDDNHSCAGNDSEPCYERGGRLAELGSSG